MREVAKQSGETEKILRRSWALSSVLGHSWVGTEHLLIAIAMTTDCPAGRLLAWHGVTAEELIASSPTWQKAVEAIRVSDHSVPVLAVDVTRAISLGHPEAVLPLPVEL